MITNRMAFITEVEKEEKNNKVMQLFVSNYPDFTGEVTIMKKDKETSTEKYERHYNYEVESGKYRKYRFSSPFSWKNSKGKLVN
ncbi:hypothetical protein [Bacillus yapensis]|nr:hypothetical protein [Bacillus yapensis]